MTTTIQRVRWCWFVQFNEVNHLSQMYHAKMTTIKALKRKNDKKFNEIWVKNKKLWDLVTINDLKKNCINIRLQKRRLIESKKKTQWVRRSSQKFKKKIMSRIHFEICLEVSTNLSDSLARNLDNNTWLLFVHTFICIVIILINHNTTMLSHLIFDNKRKSKNDNKKKFVDVKK